MPAHALWQEFLTKFLSNCHYATAIFYKKKLGYQVDLPKRNKTTIPTNTVQEVVKVDVINDATEICDCSVFPKDKKNPDSKILTIRFSDCSLEIPAGTDMILLSQVIRSMRCTP